jgi:hypothetical protein
MTPSVFSEGLLAMPPYTYARYFEHRAIDHFPEHVGFAAVEVNNDAIPTVRPEQN